MINQSSIYKRFVGFFILFMIICTFFAGLITYQSARVEINRDYDSQMRADNFIIYMLVREELEEKNNLDEIQSSFKESMKDTDAVENMAEYDDWRAFRIWKGNKLLLKSMTAPGASVPATLGEEFSIVRQGSQQWRVYTEKYQKHGLSIEVWENLENRNSLYHQIFVGFIKSLIVVVPLSILLLIFFLRLEFKKIKDLISQIRNRAPDSMEPLVFKKIPQEIKPLLQAINDLIFRVKSSLERERLFINSAAHELKTPLTALSLQSQILPDTELGRSLCATISRATHLVNQMLILARVEHNQSAEEECNLHDICAELLSERVLLISDKDLSIMFKVDIDSNVYTQKPLFKILLGTLLDNAIKYTPSGGEIRLQYSEGSLFLEDSGAGIPEAERTRVFEKFFRGANATQEEGSGLGLAIAKEIITILHIDMKLGASSDLGGLLVRLDFSGKTR